MAAHHRRGDPYVPRPTGRARHPELVTLGGSGTAIGGLSSKSPDRWPVRVGRQLDIPVLDMSKPGQTLRDAVDSMAVDRAFVCGASFATIGFGMDDCLRLDVGEFSGLLDRVLYEAETTAVTPLLLTAVWLPYPAHFTMAHWDEALAPFNDAIRCAAEERSVGLIDVAARREKQIAQGRVEHVRGDEAAQLVAGSRLIGHLVLQALRASRAAATSTPRAGAGTRAGSSPTWSLTGSAARR